MDIVFSMNGSEKMGEMIATCFEAEKGLFKIRRFPDGETYLRVLSEVKGKDVLVIDTLDRPDEKILPLYYLSKFLRENGAKKIALFIPYLPYMRQDKQFHPGEAITSGYFAGLISSLADELFTIDPHLHRYHSLEQIYSIPCTVIHAAGLISDWIKEHIKKPLLIGPDEESRQWVEEIAKNAGAPFIVLEKTRKGDKNVEVSVPDVEKYKDHVPVLADDIISTAHTMIETVRHIRDAGMNPPVCIGVHAIFAGNAYQELLDTRVAGIVTCNTVVHVSNEIDVSDLFCKAMKDN